MRPVTPRGFRDVLPREAAERASVSAKVSGACSSWGYELVETPVVEVYATLEAAAGDLEGTAFRLFDLDGSLLALRPDMTVPIARMIATRLADEPGALRFRYAAEVFREHESLRGQAREFTQLGVELVGAGGPAADAEVLAVLVEALSSAGLEEFTVSVGTVAVLNALVDAAGGDSQWRLEVLAAAHDRNVVALDRLSRAAGVDSAAGEALRTVVRLRGGAEAIDAARDAVAPCGCESTLGALAKTWSLLEVAGVSDRVMVDFSVMRSFDYYTGLVFEAYAPGLGLPLGGGGRYDAALAAFGAPRPAAGFALGLERLLIALSEQGIASAGPSPAVLVGGEAAAAFAKAAELRGRDIRVALAPGIVGGALEELAARRGAEAVEAR